MSLKAWVVFLVLVGWTAAVQAQPSAAAEPSPDARWQALWQPPPERPRETPWSDDERHVSLGFQAGFAVRGLYDIPLYVGEVELQLGARASHPGYYHAVIGGMFGSTENGLSTRAGFLGASLAWPIDRVQIGLVPRFGVLAIRRVTEDRDILEVLVGIHLRTAVDIVRFPPYHALYADLRVGVDGAPMAKPQAGLYGGGLGLGFRY